MKRGAEGFVTGRSEASNERDIKAFMWYSVRDLERSIYYFSEYLPLERLYMLYV